MLNILLQSTNENSNFSPAGKIGNQFPMIVACNSSVGCAIFTRYKTKNNTFALNVTSLEYGQSSEFNPISSGYNIPVMFIFNKYLYRSYDGSLSFGNYIPYGPSQANFSIYGTDMKVSINYYN